MKIYRTTVLTGALSATALVVALTAGGCSSTTTTTSTPDSGSDTAATTTTSSSGSSSGSSTSSGSSSGSDAETDGSSSGDATTDGSSSGDAATDGSSSGTEAAASDSGCSGTTPIELSIYNFKAWCNVSVAGTAITTPGLGTTEKQTVCVAAGTDLSATAVTGFEIGTPPLPFLSGADTVTDDGTTAKTTLKTGSTCVFICCPFAAGTGCTEADGGALPNPCP
jgi:hypothetical protein